MTVKEVCILTVSDRCSRGEAEDTSGQALAEFFSDKPAFKVTQRLCVPDEKKEIINALDRWVKMKVNLILTTGKGPRENHGGSSVLLPLLETEKARVKFELSLDNFKRWDWFFPSRRDS